MTKEQVYGTTADEKYHETGGRRFDRRHYRQYVYVAWLIPGN